MDKILVTGSAGFIGSNVIKKLSNYEVVTNHNDSGRIDLQNIEQVMKLDSVDTVIHLAGKIPWRELSSNEFSDNNIKCTQNICLLYTSPSPRDLSTSRMPSSA